MAIKILGSVRLGDDFVSVEADSIEEYLSAVVDLQSLSVPETNKKMRVPTLKMGDTNWSCPEHGSDFVRYKIEDNYYYCAKPLVAKPTKGSKGDWCSHTSWGN